MMLWLSSRKPAESDESVPVENVVQVDDNRSFSWAVNPEEEQAALTDKPIGVDTVQVISSRPTINRDSTAGAEAAVGPPPVAAIPQDTVQLQRILVNVPDDKSVHVVVAGETLYGIANQHRVGVMELVAWNNLNLKDGIKPGQVIKLADDQPVARAETKAIDRVNIEHEVKPTDTLYSVARKYNVTIQDLMEWNNKKDFSLSVGEKLKIQAK
jgi:membrane-bound lytic murein transglycosylase D